MSFTATPVDDHVIESLPTDVTVTASTYGHLSVEDARKAMEQAGWFGQAQVNL